MAYRIWFIASFPTPLFFRYHLPLKCGMRSCKSVWLPITKSQQSWVRTSMLRHSGIKYIKNPKTSPCWLLKFRTKYFHSGFNSSNYTYSFLYKLVLTDTTFIQKSRRHFRKFSLVFFFSKNAECNSSPRRNGYGTVPKQLQVYLPWNFYNMYFWHKWIV